MVARAAEELRVDGQQEDAFRMLNDADELQRFRRLERARQRGSRSTEPGRDGVHFRAKDPSAGGGIEPARSRFRLPRPRAERVHGEQRSLRAWRLVRTHLTVSATTTLEVSGSKG